MKTFLPYYEEIKLAGHAGCAYAAGLLSAIAMLIGRYFAEVRFREDTIFTFSFLASGAIWIVPFLKIVPSEYSEYISLAILIFCIFVVKFISHFDWKRAFFMWFVFAIAQTILFLILYYNILK